MQLSTTNVIPFPVKVRKPAEVQFDESGLPITWDARLLSTRGLSSAAKVIGVRLFIEGITNPSPAEPTVQWIMEKASSSRSTVYRALADLKAHGFIDDDLAPIETEEDLLGFDEHLRMNGEPPRAQWLRESHAKVRARSA